MHTHRSLRRREVVAGSHLAPERRAPSLDKATFSPADAGTGHGQARVTLYPAAGEAVVSVMRGQRAVDRSRKHHVAKDPERCKVEARKRAQRELRRFCKANGLFFMWTLT